MVSLHRRVACIVPTLILMAWLWTSAAFSKEPKSGVPPVSPSPVPSVASSPLPVEMLAGTKNVTLTPRNYMARTRERLVESLVNTYTPDFLQREKDRDVVHLFFDESGSVLSLPLPRGYVITRAARTVIDDNDAVVVHLICQYTRRYEYKVEVKASAVRSSPLSVFGLPAQVRFKALKDEAESPRWDAFVENSYIGGPYSGDLTVSITVPNALGGDASNPMTHKYGVHELYQYEAVMGVFGSELADAEFESFSPPGDARQFIRQKSEGDKVGLAIAVIPFLDRGGRDLFELPDRFVKRMNPILGLGLSDIGKNFYAGMAIEISRGAHLALGANIRKVKSLDGGQRAGSVVPEFGLLTHESWETKPFIGLTIPFAYFQEIFNGATKP